MELQAFVGVRCEGRTCVFLVSPGRDDLVPLEHWKDDGTAPGRGFEWGYGGAGPRRLAEAMLLVITGDELISATLAQRFKWDRIARLPRPFFCMTALEVEAWYVERVAEMPQREQAELLDLGFCAEGEA